MTSGDVDRFAQAVVDRLRAERDDRPLLSPKELASRLGVSERTARELIGAGTIPSVTVAKGARRVEQAAVDAYLAARREAS